jgi:hypothetical protein
VQGGKFHVINLSMKLFEGCVARVLLRAFEVRGECEMAEGDVKQFSPKTAEELFQFL